MPRGVGNRAAGAPHARCVLIPAMSVGSLPFYFLKDAATRQIEEDSKRRIKKEVYS